jgi:hypothetical protein
MSSRRSSGQGKHENSREQTPTSTKEGRLIPTDRFRTAVTPPTAIHIPVPELPHPG